MSTLHPQGKPRDPADVRAQIMDANIPKNDAEWWANKRIVAIEADNATLKHERDYLLAKATEDAIIIGQLNGGAEFQSLMKTNNDLRADNRALRTSWDELQRENLRLTDERDRLTQALKSIRTFVLGPAMGPPSAIERHIAGMVDAALAPLPSAGQEG